jgi:preprotein translocase subunit Sec63
VRTPPPAPQVEDPPQRTGRVRAVKLTAQSLGIQPGASQKDIDVACKKKAKMYNPDRVVSLTLEVRKMVELRMKEINTAYAEFKRKAR